MTPVKALGSREAPSSLFLSSFFFSCSPACSGSEMLAASASANKKRIREELDRRLINVIIYLQKTINGSSVISMNVAITERTYGPDHTIGQIRARTPGLRSIARQKGATNIA
jgi:hypothetical protein